MSSQSQACGHAMNIVKMRVVYSDHFGIAVQVNRREGNNNVGKLIRSVLYQQAKWYYAPVFPPTGTIGDILS